MKIVQSALFGCLPGILFGIGLTWVLLFPAVSISSGELKPRGIYVDEHSLLVQSNMVGAPKLMYPFYYAQESEVCKAFDPATSHCSYDENTRISQIEVLPRHSANFFDTTILVFQFNSSEDCSYRTSVTLAHSVAMELNKSRWNARKVQILLLPAGNNSTQSVELQSWLKQQHTPTTEEIIDAEISELSALSSGSNHSHRSSSVGHIREVYIFDLTDLTICNNNALVSTSTLSAASNVIAAASTGYKDAIIDPISFDAAVLHYTGPNGLLPNMDLIAYPLAKFPKVLITESQQCATALHKTIDAFYMYYVQSDADSLVDTLLKPLFTVLYTVDTALPLAYRQRLLGLFCSMHALVFTEHSLHGYFAHYNIDAITIKPSKTTTAGKIAIPIKTAGKSSKKRNGYTTKRSATNTQYGSETLLHMAMSFLYISNNLQEELHHSHFYYLIMGSGHFTSINEYGFTAAIFLLSLLFMLVQVSSKCSIEGVTQAISTVLVSIVPIFLWVVAIVPIILQHSMESVERCSTAVEVVQSLHKSGDIHTLVVCILCHFRTACLVLKDYIAVHQVETVTRTLFSLTCATVLMSSVFGGADNGQQVASVPSTIPVNRTNLGNTVVSERGLGDNCSEKNEANTDSIQIPTSTSFDKSTSMAATSSANLLSLCLLSTLVILAHTFAHHFSLGLFLTCVYLPSLIFVTLIQLCTAKTAKWKLVAFAVFLITLIVYHGILMLFIESWFSAHTYPYKLCIILSCVVSIGVCSTVGVLIRMLC